MSNDQRAIPPACAGASFGTGQEVGGIEGSDQSKGAGGESTCAEPVDQLIPCYIVGRCLVASGA